MLELVQSTKQETDVAEAGWITQVPEYRIWLAALARLIHDAKLYEERLCDSPSDQELEQAHNDVMKVGPMLCYVCSMTGHDPNIASKTFRQWRNDFQKVNQLDMA